MRTRSKVWLLSAVIAVIGVALGAIWLAGGPSTTRTPIAFVTTDEQGLQVSLTYSSCDELDHIDVVESARTVTLTAHVHSRAPGTCGTDPMLTDTAAVRLKAPLEDRGVVDGTTGAAIPAG